MGFVIHTRKNVERETQMERTVQKKSQIRLIELITVLVCTCAAVVGRTKQLFVYHFACGLDCVRIT